MENAPSQPKKSNNVIGWIIIFVLVIIIAGYWAYETYYKNIDTAQDNDLITNKTTAAININAEEKLSSEELLDSVYKYCANFINDHQFIDPGSFFYVADPEPLKELANDWTWGQICQSADNNSILVVSVNKQANADDKIQQAAFNNTRKNYPQLSKEFNLTSDETYYYKIYLYANYPTEINYGTKKKSFEPARLESLTDLIWSSALSGCHLEPGNYIADKGVVISCGGGDNMCSEMERVKWNIIDNTKEYLGVCTNNCDLGPDESYVLNCKPFFIEPS